MTVLSRRHVLATSAALPLFAIVRARAAQRFVIKFGVDLPADHPTSQGATAAGETIKQKTNGDVTVQVFPNNQLGDDTHMLSNIRVGAMQMMGIGDNILATLGTVSRHRQYRLRLQGFRHGLERAGRRRR